MAAFRSPPRLEVVDVEVAVELSAEDEAAILEVSILSLCSYKLL